MFKNQSNSSRKQIKSLEEVQGNIEMYVRKDLPMLPALQQIQRETKNYKLGYKKQRIQYLLEEDLQRNSQ